MTGNPIVDKISQIRLHGNIAPSSWFKCITLEDGKADLVAITILSDVIYWYRWTEVRDESTGLVLRYDKKFEADMLQRSYQQMADMFGISKRQATDAVSRLKKAGLITTALRNFPKNGLYFSNVLYIAPVPEKLVEITYKEQAHVKKGGIPRLNVTPPTPQVGTYTETISETSTDNSVSSAAPPVLEKASKKGKPKKQAHPWKAPLIARWCELWKAKYSATYVIEGADLRKIDAVIAKGGSVEECASIFTQYLQDSGGGNDFYKDNSHTLRLLDVNKYKPRKAIEEEGCRKLAGINQIPVRMND
jgi:hypothetical protein